MVIMGELCVYNALIMITIAYKYAGSGWDHDEHNWKDPYLKAIDNYLSKEDS